MLAILVCKELLRIGRISPEWCRSPVRTVGRWRKLALPSHRQIDMTANRAETARIQAAADGCETAAERLQPTSRRAKLPAAKGASPVRAIKTTPEALATLAPGAIGSLPFEQLAAMLKAAEEQTAKPARQPAAPRVSLTDEAREAFAAMGWTAPKVTAHSVTQPERRERQNKCKGAAAYTVAVAVLQNGPLPLGDLARLWLASGNQPKAIAAIAQQIANRAGVAVIQTGDTLQLATD